MLIIKFIYTYNSIHKTFQIKIIFIEKENIINSHGMEKTISSIYVEYIIHSFFGGRGEILHSYQNIIQNLIFKAYLKYFKFKIKIKLVNYT